MQDALGKPGQRFFVRNGDHVDGPHEKARILAWHAEGRLPDDVLLSPDGRTWSRVRWPRESSDCESSDSESSDSESSDSEPSER